jgi:hypothetical protein
MFEQYLNTEFEARQIDAMGNNLEFASAEPAPVLKMLLCEVKRFPHRLPTPDFPREQFSLLFRGQGEVSMSNACLCAIAHEDLGTFHLMISPIQFGSVPVEKSKPSQRYYEIAFA